ncbi:indolepyruvate ferredoxin oxidoreductase subunit alpha [bacterium 210820-DFI.6.37]|nr:indolepyruvate ferredoxin oxidoreductase subunit alpha [bacterium 210820-DFI.6.37]
MKELLMGNEAVALGALAAGVQVVAGYPGTPSSEALETIAKRNPGNVHVEWSVNEKASVEVAAGAACAGARSMVTMKQMGLNVASDPVMCINYVGVKGGMVIYVADDPGPISSQTEQDTRAFARYLRIPLFDCDSPEQAFYAVQDAFEFSEKHETPVILRATTRVCHACADIDVPDIAAPEKCEGFVKDPKWVIFPKRSYQAKMKLAADEPAFAEEFSSYLSGEGKLAGNSMEGAGRTGIACGGISYAYVKEAIRGFEENFKILKIATPYPFPERLAKEFMMSVDKVIVFEELDPYIEDALIYTLGRMGSSAGPFIEGKRTGAVPAGGELSASVVSGIIERVTGLETGIASSVYDDAPAMPVRPPVLCAGCPHRGAFYAVKKAVGGQKAVYCGDIGCYTLGNAAPLDMVDTCLCMGAGITMAQGLNHADPDTVNFAFVGDSTFFASGITGTVNGVYNQADMILCVLDNSTTAMTGHQPHPGMGITMMGKRVTPIDIAKVLEGIGVESVRTVDPLDLTESVQAVKAAMEEHGVRAIIFKSPCIAITKPSGSVFVDKDACVGCVRCIREIGCPALITRADKAFVDKSLCTGCGLCAQICPVGCIGREESL